jgi:hypothetical protein
MFLLVRKQCMASNYHAKHFHFLLGKVLREKVFPCTNFRRNRIVLVHKIKTPQQNDNNFLSYHAIIFRFLF